MFSLMIELKPYLTSKVTQRHINIYKEKLLVDIILSKNYEDFNEKRRFIRYEPENFGKKKDKYPRVKYNTFYDITRAYFLWTTDLSKDTDLEKQAKINYEEIKK